MKDKEGTEQDKFGTVLLEWRQVSTPRRYLNVNIQLVCSSTETNRTIVFYNYHVWFSYSRFITEHNVQTLDYIERCYNSAHIFTNLPLIPQSIAYCCQMHPSSSSSSSSSSTSLKIWSTDLLCFHQSIQWIFIGLPALILPREISSKFLYCDLHLLF